MLFIYFLADDGEVFKVKKSTQSKKIKKLLEKERKKKKEKIDVNSSSNQEKSIQNQLDNDVIIKLKNTFVSISINNYLVYYSIF